MSPFVKVIKHRGNKPYAHKLFRGTTWTNYQIPKKTMSLKKQQTHDDENVLTRIMIFCQQMKGCVIFLSSTISPNRNMEDINCTVESWISETVEVIKIVTESFCKEENLDLPQPFQRAGSVSMFPIHNKAGSIIVQLILWSCLSQACHNSITKCLNDASEGKYAFPQQFNSDSKGMLWIWLQSYAFCIKASVHYSCKDILAKVQEDGEMLTLIGKHFSNTNILEAHVTSGIISRSSRFFTMIGTNAQPLDCLTSPKSRPQPYGTSSAQRNNMAVAATKQFLRYLKTRQKVTFIEPLRRMIGLSEFAIETHVTCDILTLMLRHKEILTHYKRTRLCERACSGVPRSMNAQANHSMDAKANYPENDKPTWQCCSELELSRVDHHHDSNLRGDAKDTVRASLVEAMGSRDECLGKTSFHNHVVNAKERARSAAHTRLNNELLKRRYCHVYESQVKKSTCSHRSQAGYIYPAVVDEVPVSKNTWRRRQKRKNKKGKKQRDCLIPVYIPAKLANHIHKWSEKELEDVTLVFDGGVDGNPPISAPVGVTWTSLRINDGDLYVADTMDDSKGLIYPVSDGVSPFMRLPRKAALSMTKMDDIKENKRFCTALHSGAQAQRAPLKRGKSKLVFTDGNFADKYSCIGVQVNRGSKGVRGESYQADKMPVKDWNVIVEMIIRAETAFCSFANTEDIQHIERASELLQFQTMGAKTSTMETIFADIYQGIALGENVFLECHADHDFARSIVMVQIDNHQCGPNDRVVAYFCLPRLGIAVALRPGDLLIFNALEPHAISSRCHKSDKLLCVSMYLKTAVVGLNNNDIKLTEKQEEMRGIYKKQKE